MKKALLNNGLLNYGEVEHFWMAGPFPDHQPSCDFLFYFAFYFAKKVHVIVDNDAELLSIKDQYPFANISQVTSYTSPVEDLTEKSNIAGMEGQFILAFKESDWQLAATWEMTPLPINNLLVNEEILQPFALKKQPELASSQTATETSSKTKSSKPRKVAIIGPESSGKSTLAMQLSKTFHCLLIHEYARHWLSFKGNVGNYDDISVIAKVQIAIEKVVSGQVDEIVLFDTGLPTVQVWSDVLFGQTPDWLAQQVMQHHYDFVLLLAPDLPWSFDPQRCQPSVTEREQFFDKCESLLMQVGIDYQVIAGEHRLQQARKVLMHKFNPHPT